MDCRGVGVFDSDFELIEYYGDLFVGRGQEQERTVQSVGVVGRVSGRVEVSAFLGLAAVREETRAIRRGCSRYEIF